MFVAFRLIAARVGLATAMLCLLGCTARAEKKPPAPPAREVEILTLAPSEVRDSAEYLGNVVSRESVSILPQVSGYVRRIAIRPGQVVKAGDVLVELDARQERAALESADAEQRAAASNAELAARTLERTQALQREGLVSGQELDRAESQAKAAEAQRRAAEARAAEQRVALGFHAVKAPFGGTVGDVAARIGDFVTASTPLTTITQGSALEVQIRVPAERARLARVGMPVELLGADGAVKVKTSIFFVAPQADPRTQLVDVSAAFSNELGLRPSEMVRTRIVYGTRRALTVPVLAIVRQSGQAFVYAVDQRPSGAVVARRPVTLGALSEQSYVVEKGLAPGDRVVVSSLQLLRDGAPVKPKPPGAPAAKAR
jgi:RND family efflux transporter MFP subunit